MNDAHQQLSQRLERLEELQSFTDRRADELSEQVVALERKVREFDARLRRLEQSLGQLNERVERIPLPPAVSPGDAGAVPAPGADDSRAD